MSAPARRRKKGPLRRSSPSWEGTRFGAGRRGSPGTGHDGVRTSRSRRGCSRRSRVHTRGGRPIPDRTVTFVSRDNALKVARAVEKRAPEGPCRGRHAHRADPSRPRSLPSSCWGRPAPCRRGLCARCAGRQAGCRASDRLRRGTAGAFRALPRQQGRLDARVGRMGDGHPWKAAFRRCGPGSIHPGGRGSDSLRLSVDSRLTCGKRRRSDILSVAPPAGLEPAAKCLEGTCSIH